jgi:glycerol-3-phosphate acyltransferase PlsY
MQTVGILLFAYLVGSIPTGFVLGALSGVDVRQGGSGNIGTTNVVRLVGWKAGLLTLLADMAKGIVPIFIAILLDVDLAVQAQAGLATFIGHLYPVFLKFRGGKGVATSLGILATLTPWVVLVLIAVFTLVAVTTRWVSLASISAAIVTPALVWSLSYGAPVFWVSLILSTLVILRHKENIQRLYSGTEPRFNLRSS